MTDLFVVDSLVFLMALGLCVVVLWRRTREAKGLRTFGLLYIASTVSSYNIMVAPVHDYNLVIARTFFTHAKVIGPLSPLDVLMLVAAVYAIGHWLLGRSRRLVPPEFRLIVVKDVLLAIVSLALFTALSARTASPWAGEIAWYRQGLYYIALFGLCMRYLERDRPHDIGQVFVTFLIIDGVNFAAGFLSTLVYGDMMWQRYFFNVTIIDQDDVMIAVTYAVMLIYMWVRKSTFGLGRGAIWASLAITVLLLANFYKGSIAIILLFLPFLLAYSVVKRADIVRPLLTVMFLIPVAAVFAWVFFIAYDTTPLETRQNQVQDLAVFMNDLGREFPVLGIGNGTLYDRDFSEEDRGEAKAIDLAENEGKASFIQTPVAQVYKATGIFGLIIHLLVFFVASSRILNRVVVNHPASVAAGYLVCMQFLLNFFFIDPTGTMAFVVAKLFLFTAIAKRQSRSAALETRGHASHRPRLSGAQPLPAGPTP